MKIVEKRKTSVLFNNNLHTTKESRKKGVGEIQINYNQGSKERLCSRKIR